ncbi:ABC transporter substrate-binding protein [Halalkalibacter nanhaiisediminis]|uniref:Peptide/nickel transport system substrate-binding protein n=1 Tax=Halalkalibacter nanhaiisediminis TaxID=688079 RepID=A0A562QSC1_9BACI|nr:ABC transporter substrate-binding protein [Halalkalibacter nanhaiisediminis]TWI59080.1 peptide/nickel transport system substrate-binding protein [Halalkalibacter nanhaiisediminis]
MKKRFNFITHSLFYLLFSTLLIGCNSQTVSDVNSNADSVDQAVDQEQDEVKTLRLGWPTDAGFPSPFAFNTSGPAGFLRVSYLYDTLTWKNEQGVVPWLAKNWEISDDGLTYTVHLNEGVNWHDGEPLTASDVEFTIRYLSQHAFLWGDISMINAVEVKDEATVVFHLDKPYSPFVEEVMGIVPIIPEHIWSNVEDPKSFREDGAVVGTGPYILKSYNQESGQYLFQANANYFKGKPEVDEISYIMVGNRALALKNNDIDAIWTNNYHDMQELKNVGFQVMESDPHGSIVRVVFNMENDFLGKKELRQAIAYALDRATIADRVLGGNGVVGSAGIIPPGSPWYNPNTKQYDFDLDNAMKMLDKLGYVDRNQDGIRETSGGESLEFNLMVSTDERDAQLIQDMLKQAGIKVNIHKVDIATFTASMSESNYDMAITSHIGVSGDPDFLRRWFMGTEYNAKASRGSVLENEQFKSLAEKQLMIADFDQRKEVVDQLQDVLAEEVPTLVIYHRPFYWMYDEEYFNGWFNTWGGIANGITSWENKAAFLPNEE